MQVAEGGGAPSAHSASLQDTSFPAGSLAASDTLTSTSAAEKWCWVVVCLEREPYTQLRGEELSCRSLQTVSVPSLLEVSVTSLWSHS